MLSILHAIWQADGTFPSGSFAFSYGVEGVVALRSRLDGAELAARISTHREAVTKILNSLEREGAITRTRGAMMLVLSLV